MPSENGSWEEAAGAPSGIVSEDTSTEGATGDKNASPGDEEQRALRRSSTDASITRRSTANGTEAQKSAKTVEATDEAKKKKGSGGIIPLMSASDLATTIAEHTKEANEEEKKLGEGTFRTLRVRIGEALQERNLKDPSGKWQVDLARDWDLNRDGSITKMEFRRMCAIQSQTPKEKSLFK